jgi:hypothetical protein
VPTAEKKPGRARDTAEQDRQNWARLVKAQMDIHQVPSAAALARMIDRPSVKRGDAARWLKAETGPAPESALRFAELFDLPAPDTLRTAGYNEIADHWERTLGKVAPGVREALTAKAREITEGAPEPEARAIIDGVLSGADDLLLAAEAKAEKAKATGEAQGGRSAS